MKRCLLVVVWMCLNVVVLRASGLDSWTPVKVPGAWPLRGEEGQDYDGFAWYRCYVKIPELWRGSRLLLVAKEVDDVDEAFFNGEKIGANGAMPPLFGRPASSIRRPFVIDPDLIRFGEYNLIAWRVYDQSGRGGILSGPVHLSRRDDAIDLAGEWLVRRGDQPRWADWLSGSAAKEVRLFLSKTGNCHGGHLGVVDADKAGREQIVEEVRKRFVGNPNVHSNVEGKGDPQFPQAAREMLRLSSGLAVDTVLHEPIVRQPLYTDFDERGRLWVVQYIQYPNPAGLKVLTWDNHLRKVFDQVPPPPPYRKPEHQRFVGRDRITYHEDTDGDGDYDQHGIFVDGLNLATSIAFAGDGLWVLNPPYLLFYPDRDQDDRPDGDPVVHLSGFGLEDTHSIANSLKWGPDGWLYGAVGSTVTARINVELSGSDERFAFFGQNIWRYHPKTYRFELFAEGGWNTFGVDFDDKGRLYSGTNGNLQAVYFVQDGYYQKNFGKHGPHTNPYAFGHFHGLPVEGEKVRLVHQWVFYSSGAIPSLQGHFVGGNSLANKMHALRIETAGSTFRMIEAPNPIQTDDKWFRPVHTSVGPDGALYISDWYDARITHVDPRDNWDRDHGRIYRLRAKRGKFFKLENLGKVSSRALVALFANPNQWLRRTAHRLLRERRDTSVLGILQSGLNGDDAQIALESLWAIHELGGFNESVALQGLSHDDPYVRLWSMRFVGDPQQSLSPAVFERVLQIGQSDPHLEVVSQTASTAQRLPAPQGLPLVRVLAGRRDVGDDDYIPQQIWWALEAQSQRDPGQAIGLFDDPLIWTEPVFMSTLGERIGRRFMAERSEENLEICAGLLREAPSASVAKLLVRGMEKALEGREIDQLPASLETAVARLWARFPLDADLVKFALRLGIREGKRAAREFVNDERQLLSEREDLIRSLSQLRDAESLPLLVRIFQGDENPESLRLVSLNGLRRYSDEGIPPVLLSASQSLQGDLRKTALSVMAGRPSWAVQLLQAVDRGKLPREAVAYENLLLMQRSKDLLTQQLIRKHWGALRQPEEAKVKRMEAVRQALATGRGDPLTGKQLFEAACGVCHRLFDSGKVIGPELTGYERDNLEFMLTAIVDPSLAVREEFEMVTVTLRRRANEREATVLVGFVTERDENSLTLTDMVGNESVIGFQDIAGQERSRLSAMPEGLLDAMTDQQIRDLFAFLQQQSCLGR
ncbi:MAG: hypothetical protein M2R45_02382 [Verrucomicrobia subdivision 3 bacterium]|nr:hypothetical protein [Limisphaerales bacterium]MCS1414932.1 hypothetical protein [Limisphaerales bacterium]